MRNKFFRCFNWLLFFLLVGGSTLVFADGKGVTLQTDGTQITLPAGWDKLDQPENFFVQTRARNIDRKIAMSAGSFKLDLTTRQYVALGIFGLEQGNAERAVEQGVKIAADLTHSSVEEIQKALQSKIGKQMLAQIKNQSTVYRSDFLSTTNAVISNVSAFEVHSRMTITQSGQVVFIRQFIYQGTEPQQIVQITFASPDEGILQDQTLVGAIKVHSLDAEF